MQGGENKEYVGACRVFGIADKLIFEQLTEKDEEEMSMCAHPRLARLDSSVSACCLQAQHPGPL